MTSDNIVAVGYQQELERLQAQVSELALTLMTRDAEMDELVARVVAWADAADEIERLRSEVDDLQRINMNLRYLIPDSVWMDEVDRLRSGDRTDLTVQPESEIERLRALITAWADADDVVERDYQFRDWDALEYGCDQRELSKARVALRKAVGR